MANSEGSGHDRIDVEAIKQSVSLVDVMEMTGLALKQVGSKRQWSGRCPFGTHPDKTASLKVSPDEGLWNCFGCEAGGNVLNYLERKEGLSFLEAVQWLEQRGLVDLAQGHVNGHVHGNGKAPTPTATPTDPPATSHYAPSELLAQVVHHYTQRFVQYQAAQNYMRSRGLSDPALWETFKLGFSDGSLLKLLPNQGELRDVLTQLGVLNAKGKEHFLGCVVVPLEHTDHGVVGLYGRRIADGTVRHVLLPGPQRGVFHWNTLQLSRQVVLAESVLDAMALWQAGIKNVTCLYGVKNLPPDLDALLGRFATQDVCFCLDGDGPGRDATDRIARLLMGRGIRCRAVMLPEGEDPNSLLLSRGAEALRQAVAQAVPLADSATPVDRSEVEPTGDGFLLHFGDLTYRVTPRPPFKGQLKVTLKATQGDRGMVDSQDLYLARNRTAIATQLQRTFSLPRMEADRHLLDIIDKTEAWVVAFEKPAEHIGFKVPAMSSEDKAEALAFLRRPDLVAAILADMEALGYVGEEKGKLLAYLIGVSRRLDKPMAGIVLSQSGAGKSSLTDLVEALCPTEDVVLFSRLSTLALAYMPKDCLKRKLLILEERTGGEAADYSIRVLLSRHKFSQAVVVKDPATGTMRTQTFEVEGPIAYLETTTNPYYNDENASRCFEVGIDESETQTARIHQIQRARRSLEGLNRAQDTEAIKRRHHHAQRLLEPVRVLIPYAEHLTFPTRWLRTRRDNERFLSLIDAIAFLHQHQRERGTIPHPQGDIGYVTATVDDYRLAYDLAKGVLGVTLHELTRGAQELWGVIRTMVAELKRGRKGAPAEDLSFTRRIVRDHSGWPDHRLQDAIQELVDMEYLSASAGGQGKAYHYRLLSDAESTPSPLGQLTTPEQLEARLRQAG